MKKLAAALCLFFTLAMPGVTFALSSCSTTARPHICRCVDAVTGIATYVAC